MRKLKRLNSGLNYSEVRSSQKKTTDYPAQDSAPTERIIEETPNTQDAKPSDPVADLPRVVEAEITAAEPAKETPDITAHQVEKNPAEPSKKLDRIETALVSARAKSRTPGSEDAKRPKGQGSPAVAKIAEAQEPPASSDRRVIKGYIARPAPGASKTYDSIAGPYGEKAATSFLLDAAIKAFETDLIAGKVGSVETDPSYASMPAKFQTMRYLSGPASQVVVELIDPLRILRPGTFGTSVLQAAINHFIANEKRLD